MSQTNIKHAIIPMVAFVLIMQIIMISAPIETRSVSSIDSNLIDVSEPLIISPVQSRTAGAFDEDPLLVNMAINPSFEDVNQYNAPSYWNCYGTGYSVRNSSYQDRVHSGSYAGQLIAEGAPSWDTYAGFYKYPSLCYLVNDLSFDFYYYFNSLGNPDLGGFYYSTVGIYTGSNWQYIYYYYSYPSWFTADNGSSYIYYFLDSELSQWNHISRSITDDYEDYFGAASGTTYIFYIYWYIISPPNPDVPIEVIMDDVSVRDSSFTEYIVDGGFELQSWGSGITSPATIQTTPDCTDGLKSAHLSISSIAEYSSSYAYMSNYFDYPPGLFAGTPESLYLDFDWKYYDTWNGGGQNAYVYFYIRNATHSCQLGIILGWDLDSPSVSNSSNWFWVTAEHFGSRNTWNHASIDVASLWQEFGISNMVITEMYFWMDLGWRSNSTVSLLIDDVNVRTYPTRDPGFELFWHASNPISGWYTSGPGYPYCNYSSDSHGGEYSANITLWGGSSLYQIIYQHTNLQVTSGLFTDMWWRLDTFDSGSDCLAEITLYFDNWNKELHYLLAGGTSLANTSYAAYYIVGNHSLIGQWFNLVRNIYSDIAEVFGESDWTIDGIYIISTNEPDEIISVLFDDIHLILDTHAPVLTEIIWFPSIPMYYESVVIQIEASDVTKSGGTLSYYNGLDWNTIPLNEVDDHLEAIIPPLPYDTPIQYYLNLTDAEGNWAIYDNSGVYYSYDIGDDIDPIISISSPHDDDVITGWVSFVIDTYDPDIGSSGIHYVEIWVNGSYSGSIYGPPYEFSGDSRLASNGLYAMEFRAYDNAGNWASDTVIVFVLNDHDGPILSIIDINPRYPLLGEDVVVSIAITDQTGIDNATLFYRKPLGTWQQVIMDSSGPLYFGTISAQTDTDIVEYYIVAYDLFGQSSSSGTPSLPHTFDIITEVAEPVITEVLLSPEIPVYDQPVSVSIRVVAEAGVQDVILYYKLGDASWTLTTMTLTRNQYVAQIPAAPWSTVVSYYIVVTDEAAQSVSHGTSLSPMTYTVTDTISPTLTVIGPTTSSPISGNVSFYISGTDAGSGIANVELIVNGTSVWSNSDLPILFIFDTSTLPNGVYTMVFVLEDNAGNVATIAFEYVIANPDFFGSIGEGLNAFMQSFGFFVGAVTFVILIIAIKIIARRRG